jgi:hypothetical protein
LYNLLSEEKFYYCTIGFLLYLSGSTILFFCRQPNGYFKFRISVLPWTLNAILVVIYHVFILFEWRKIFYLKKTNINHENKPTFKKEIVAIILYTSFFYNYSWWTNSFLFSRKIVQKELEKRDLEIKHQREQLGYYYNSRNRAQKNCSGFTR